MTKYYLSLLGFVIFLLSFYIFTILNKSKRGIYSLIITIIASIILSVYHNFYVEIEYKLTFYNVVKYFNIIPVTISILYFLISITNYSKITINILITLYFINYIKISTNTMYYNFLYYYNQYYFFLLGMFIPLFIEAIKFYFGKKTSSFWSILEHELTHALFAFLLGGNIKKLVVEENKGGHVLYEMSRLNKYSFLITLAPYFFPTLLSLFFLVGLIFNLKPSIPFNIFSGILFSIHIISTIKETHFHQEDLLKYGLKTSFYFICLMNFIIIIFILLVISLGFYKALIFLISGLIFKF